ncbi:MAG: sugar ABC transporter ATP-binding protein [Acidimicrobiia bacterium]
MSTPQLRIDGLSKTFPGVRALRGVDLQVEPGEVHALVGANGSGKSTLIKVLAGMHRPDAGASASVRGEPLVLGSVTAAGRAGLRFVHQDPGLVMNLDVADNFALGRGYARGRCRQISWRAHVESVQSALDGLGFSLDVRRPLQDLSASQRTGVAIARAIHGLDAQAALLVLDEPTASLPRPEVEALFEVVERVRALGVAVIYVSHHLDEVFAVSDRVTVLRDGRRVATFRTAEVDHGELVHAMVGSALEGGTARAAAIRTSPVLEVEGLGGRSVRRVDLEVRQGEIVGVAGLTGSGREELLSLLFGGRPRRGTVSVRGREVPPMRPDLSVALGLGLVPADRRNDGMLPMSVLENLTIARLAPYWRRMLLRSRPERRDGAALLQRLTVRPSDPGLDLATLSGGNQQKVMLGRWLRLDPAVLLLDDPTQGVDVGAKQEIYGLLEESAARGTGILVCSSDDEELERLCHRVLVLNDGEVTAELAGSSLTSSRITHAALATRPGTTKEPSLR